MSEPTIGTRDSGGYTPTVSLTLAQAARCYAAAGLAVFPLTPRGKTPLISKEAGGNGCKDATCDAATVDAWWQRYPDANIGLHCGEASGVLVIDIDNHPPKGRHPPGGALVSGMAAWAEITGDHPALPATVTQDTGGGGVHLFFRMPVGRPVKNRNGGTKLPDGRVAAIDVRSGGGYVVLPPSIHPSGAAYAWRDGAGLEPADCPGWLLDLVDPPDAPAPRPAPPRLTSASADTAARLYCLAVLQSACDKISSAGEGARHATLNTESFLVGGYVAGNGHALGPAEAEAALIAAGGAAGKSEREVRRTVAEALAKGAERPIQVPERPSPAAHGGYAPTPDDAPPPDDSDRPWQHGGEGAAPMAGPAAPKVPTLPNPAPWSLAAIGEALAERLYGKGREVVRYPWPGCAPDEAEDRAPVSVGALLPEHNQAERPAWRSLAKLAGPWTPDLVAILVGATGRGKSAMAIQVAEGVARVGAPVLFASAEMSAEEVLARLLAVRSKGDERGLVSARAVLDGRCVERDFRKALAELVADCPGFYAWAPTSATRTGDDLDRMARAVSAAHGDRPPFVAVDYLQRFKGNVLGGAGDRRAEVAALSGQLRDLSRPGLNWPGAAVLALSSTARGEGSGNYKVLGSAWALREAFLNPGESLEGLGKETGEIEYDAPIVLVMTSDRSPDPRTPGPAFVAIVKARHGSHGGVRFWFRGAGGRFNEGENDPDRWDEVAKPKETTAAAKKKAEKAAEKADPARSKSQAPKLPGSR